MTSPDERLREALENLRDEYEQIVGRAEGTDASGNIDDMENMDSTPPEYAPTEFSDSAERRAYFERAYASLDNEEPRAGITVETPTLPPATPARAALETPYTLAQWRADLVDMGAGLPTGFDVLEELRMQWVPATITAVIARPGGGKTAFMLEACARFLEENTHAHALFLSWEEPIAELVSRLLLRADARRAVPANGETWLPPLHLDTVRQYARGELVPPVYRARLAAAEPAVADLLTRLHLVDGDEVGREVHATLREVGAWMREPGAPHIGLVAVDSF